MVVMDPTVAGHRRCAPVGMGSARYPEGVSSPIGARRAVPEDTMRPIVAAARECFAEMGVARTRMEHVATRVGISRQAMYRYVSGRDDLVELAVLERCREFSDELIAGTPDDPPDVVDAMVDLMIRMVRISRDDREFTALAEATPRIRLMLLLTSAGSPMHAMVSRCFDPLFGLAERDGLLRTDITRREMVEWLQGVLTVLVPRLDQDISELRRYVREFGVRALLVR